MALETLDMALKPAKARLVCRDEQYKNKAIIYPQQVLWRTPVHGDNTELAFLGRRDRWSDSRRVASQLQSRYQQGNEDAAQSRLRENRQPQAV